MTHSMFPFPTSSLSSSSAITTVNLHWLGVDCQIITRCSDDGDDDDDDGDDGGDGGD